MTQLCENRAEETWSEDHVCVCEQNLHKVKYMSSDTFCFILPAVSQHLPNFTRLLRVPLRALADRHFCVCSKNSQDLQASCQSTALSEGDIITIIKAVMTGSLSFTPSLSSILRFVLCAGKGGLRPALCHIYLCVCVCVCVCVCYYSGSFYRWKLLLNTKEQRRNGSNCLIGFMDDFS